MERDRLAARCKEICQGLGSLKEGVAPTVRSRESGGCTLRIFSFRPALTLRGRQRHGLRGWAGKPSHPPLIHVPIASYLLAAVFDLIAVLGNDQGWARDFFVAATFLMVAGLVGSVPAILTGAADRSTLTKSGTQVRRTTNAHAFTMVVVTVIAVADLVLRLIDYNDRTHPTGTVLVMTLVVAAAVVLGAAIGGTLVYDYGLNVEADAESPVWHVTEMDSFAGDPLPLDEVMSRTEWLADVEVAVTNHTPDPLDRHAQR